MSLIHYKLKNDFDKGLESFWDGFNFPVYSDFFDEKSVWSPSVDIIEDENSFLLKIELPNMKKEDFKLEVKDKVLTVSGEKKSEKEDEGKKYHRVESFYGSFSRSFSLPDNLDTEKIKAEYQNGVLNIQLEKNSSYQKSIEVKVS